MKSMIIAVFCLLAVAASAAEIRVISGGAVEPGLEAFAGLVRRDMGHELKILYNTAPQIAKRLSAGEVFAPEQQEAGADALARHERA